MGLPALATGSEAAVSASEVAPGTCCDGERDCVSAQTGAPLL